MIAKVSSLNKQIIFCYLQNDQAYSNSSADKIDFLDQFVALRDGLEDLPRQLGQGWILPNIIIIH